ncbi:MAG TPA: hypothetical protein VHA09_07520 [Nitrososphaera sp.]|nr:hypothetical protein [Nitrososphaera sp.]
MASQVFDFMMGKDINAIEKDSAAEPTSNEISFNRLPGRSIINLPSVSA